MLSPKLPSGTIINPDQKSLLETYKFNAENEIILDGKTTTANNEQKTAGWEQRMANAYEASLSKSFAIIDFSNFLPLLSSDSSSSKATYSNAEIGLRWRTQKEVDQQRCVISCSNRRCPGMFPNANLGFPALENILSYSGGGSTSTPLLEYDLPFKYLEKKELKLTVVKVSLCSGCSCLLKFSSLVRGGEGGDNKSKRKKNKKSKRKKKKRRKDEDSDSDSSSSSGEEAVNTYRILWQKAQHLISQEIQGLYKLGQDKADAESASLFFIDRNPDSSSSSSTNPLNALEDELESELIHLAEDSINVAKSKIRNNRVDKDYDNNGGVI